MKNINNICHIILFLSAFNLAHINSSSCDHGPYLYDNAFDKYSQGIGSSINRIKIDLIISLLYNLTFIPNTSCFRSNDHNTDFNNILGWYSPAECNESEVYLERPHQLDASYQARVIVVDLNESSTADREALHLVHTLHQLNPLTMKRVEVDNILLQHLKTSSAPIWRDIYEARKLATNSNILLLNRPYKTFNIEGYQV
jgi:hypothetical protein